MPTKTITIHTKQQGLIEFTVQVIDIVQQSQVQEGLCTVFIPHTSASLLIQENADPSAKRDLEHWLNRLVPEGDALYTHRLEGADDMPAHIKSALTATQLSIPITKSHLVLGAWQGIYLWEHRKHSQSRSVIVHILGD